MCLLDHLGQDGRGIVGIRIVTFKQLFGGHHDLVRCFATAAAPTHSVGHDGQYAAVDTWMLYKRDLILLVLAVAFVYACGSSESITSGHVDLLEKQYFLQKDSKVVLSNQRDQRCRSLYPY